MTHTKAVIAKPIKMYGMCFLDFCPHSEPNIIPTPQTASATPAIPAAAPEIY